METTRTMLNHGHSDDCGQTPGTLARCSYWRGYRQDNLLVDAATLYVGIVGTQLGNFDHFLRDLVYETSPDTQDPNWEYPAGLAKANAYIAPLAEAAQEGQRRQRLLDRLLRIHQLDEPPLSSPRLFSF